MTETAGQSCAYQLPLAMLKEGESATVVSVKGAPDLKQHLGELGFVEGAKVTVVSRVSGDVIVLVKGARLALNRSMAQHIRVSDR